METTPLAQLRLDLAQNKATLRDRKDGYVLVKAAAEQRAIEDGVNGKNADERERNLIVAINKDSRYVLMLRRLREIEEDIDRLEAQIENALDDRRAWEWSIRSALVDLLGQSGKDDGPAFDAALDEETFTRIQHRTMERLRNQIQPADDDDYADALDEDAQDRYQRR